MNIIEVKNNLVKLCYEEDLQLSGLIQITDSNKSYIAQVLHMEASRIGKIAVARILFNFDNGIHAYDGTIPSLRAELKLVNTKDFIDILDNSNPLVLGKLAGYKDNITVNIDVLDDNPIILSEKFYLTKVLLNNLAIQLHARNKKLVVFDTSGVFKNNKLTATKDFKLPLNHSTINYIYEKGFEDATAESKALIQSIFEELSEYSKTVDFIPFDTFKAVVDSEFVRTKLMQLVIMKNKIKQIGDRRIFAQNKAELDYVKSKLENENTIIFDISNLKESLQKECIKYVYSLLRNIDSEFYAFTPLTGENSDKFLLKEIFDTENVHSTLICDYDYANLNELKKSSKNMLMFTPLKQQKDFGGYNIFLQKLAEDEFIAYGKMTKFVPIIGKLAQITSSDVYIPQEEKPQISVPTVSVPVVEGSQELQIAEQPVPEQTDIEDSVPQEVPKEEKTEIEPEDKNSAVEENIPSEEISQSDVTNAETEQNEIEEEPSGAVLEDAVVSVEQSEVAEEDTVETQAEIETVNTEEINEIEQPVADTVEQPEVEVAEAETQVPAESETEVVTEAVAEEAVVAADTPVEETSEQNVSEDAGDELKEALAQVKDVEDEEELSDDDLDMIEKMSKSDDEIPALNPELQQAGSDPTEESLPVEEKSEETIPNQQETIEDASVATQETVETEEKKNELIVEDTNEDSEAAVPPVSEPIQARTSSSPVVPEYSAEIPDEDKVNSDHLQEGDKVVHEEFGEGVVEKMINYGDKILCSINFASVGRRLLNPEISEMKKI